MWKICSSFLVFVLYTNLAHASYLPEEPGYSYNDPAPQIDCESVADALSFRQAIPWPDEIYGAPVPSPAYAPPLLNYHNTIQNQVRAYDFNAAPFQFTKFAAPIAPQVYRTSLAPPLPYSFRHSSPPLPYDSFQAPRFRSFVKFRSPALRYQEIAAAPRHVLKYGTPTTTTTTTTLYGTGNIGGAIPYGSYGSYGGGFLKSPW